MRFALATVAAVLTLAALVSFGPTITAQTPTPQSVTIPGSATVERGGSVTFRRPSDGATLTVIHSTNSRAPSATLSHDGTALTISASAGAPQPNLISARSGAVPPSCIPNPVSPGQGPSLRCDIQPNADAPTVTFGVGPTPPSPSPSPSPIPTPTPRVITIPGETTIAENETVAFRRQDGATLTVSYRSGPERATATYDGAILTVSVPPLGLGDRLTGAGPGVMGGFSPTTCSPVNNQRNVVRC